MILYYLSLKYSSCWRLLLTRYVTIQSLKPAITPFHLLFFGLQHVHLALLIFFNFCFFDEASDESLLQPSFDHILQLLCNVKVLNSYLLQIFKGTVSVIHRSIAIVLQNILIFILSAFLDPY